MQFRRKNLLIAAHTALIIAECTPDLIITVFSITLFSTHMIHFNMFHFKAHHVSETFTLIV